MFLRRKKSYSFQCYKKLYFQILRNALTSAESSGKYKRLMSDNTVNVRYEAQQIPASTHFADHKLRKGVRDVIEVLSVPFVGKQHLVTLR